MEIPDKSWMLLRRDHPQYMKSVEQFINFAQYSTGRENIDCPCVKCANRNYESVNIVKTHLIIHCIRMDYEFWCFHGERSSTNDIVDDGVDDVDDESNNEDDVNENIIEEDNAVDDIDNDVDDHYMEDILNDLYPNIQHSSSEDLVNDDKTFYKLLDDSKQHLYEGSRISKASTLLKLLHIKNVGQWTNTSFDLLLNLLKDEILPVNSHLPNSYYECKKFITNIGLTYEKIDVCNNNCMLYRKQDNDLQRCKVCGTSRWKIDKSSGVVRKKQNEKHIPAKVLRYFPLTSRLQMLYMSSKTVPLMRWHKDSRVDDEFLRHPADSITWKSFDEHYIDFSSKPRNVRLCLASDGFQPFINGKQSYNIWPVVLIPYNVPPTICMDSNNFMLSMLIPGPKSPGDAIDIFLQPLIEELQALWHTGVRTFDASTSEYFNMHAALLWTINDFPAYANLSGWSTKGKFACPCCNIGTASMRLTNYQKECYMCHRRFLPLTTDSGKNVKPLTVI
ncbi:uncharacterized protein LOC124946317 [Impatiens glandulifera]|uniref:uncharacterized protein LOC124946317 n=1 Tax=Impatiens glandulifera TaxID=253017 RepID=UPI001FB0A7DB|nr:uncharacterized protein LOC124946317 [Impatiens glandulifera]